MIAGLTGMAGGLGLGGFGTQASLAIPIDAYRYFPTAEEELMQGLNTPYRVLFDGGIELKEEEKKGITELKEYLQENEIKLEQKEIWTDSYLFRFLQASNFKVEEAAKNIVAHTEWRKEALPPTMNDKTTQVLQSGLMYQFGRDNRFRPILIFQAKLLNEIELDIADIKNALTYFITYLTDNLLLPGQVENWIIIVDLNGVGVTNFPMNKLKESLGFMQNNFRARMYRTYAVNTPWAFRALYGAIQVFMEKSTVMKISLSGSNKDDKMAKHINPKQLEKRFGGEQETPTSFWPPICHSNEYFVEGDDEKTILITKEEYRKRFMEGKLAAYKTTVL